MNTKVVKETENDIDAIDQLTREVFGREDEAKLVSLLRDRK
jgi:predicted N-acetyltransferase YhbS